MCKAQISVKGNNQAFLPQLFTLREPSYVTGAVLSMVAPRGAKQSQFLYDRASGLVEDYK